MPDSPLAFLQDAMPSAREVAVFGPVWFFLSFLFLALAGHVRRARGWRTGHSRKLFHFLTFTTAALLQWRGGLPQVCLFGGMSSLVLLYAVWRGDGHPLYEALAREKDAPRRTHYIVVPYLATLLGGLLGNWWFGPAAMFGYLVTGVGDAVGEPVGTTFGRHPYRVPSLNSVAATRTLEGSAAVAIGSLLALAAAAWLVPMDTQGVALWWVLPLVAVACALVESVSPHGWDNLTLQLVPSALMAWILGGPVS